MKSLLKTAVQLQVKNHPVRYIIFHSPDIDMTTHVNVWLRETKTFTNISLVQYLKEKNPDSLVFTKKEAKQLNIKRTV